MCLQNWLVCSECIPKMEITFPVRLAKNCKAKYEQLWRVEKFSFSVLMPVLVGCWKVFGYEFKLGQVVAGEVGISSVQTMTSSAWIGENFWLWENIFVESLICSADLLKKDFLGCVKETCSTSYCDFAWWLDLLFFIKNINEKKRKRRVVLLEGSTVWSAEMTF